MQSVKNPRLEDMDDINRIVNEKKDKTSNSGLLLQKERRKRAGGKWRCRKLGFVILERECVFSLRSRAIGPSDIFGPRRKIVLRDESNAWAPVSWSFDKLHEVGVLSYLSYTLFKCFVNG